jgi:hypothetical protein
MKTTFFVALSTLALGVLAAPSVPRACTYSCPIYYTNGGTSGGDLSCVCVSLVSLCVMQVLKRSIAPQLKFRSSVGRAAHLQVRHGTLASRTAMTGDG